MHAKCTIPVALLKISPGDTRNSLSVLLNYASKPIDDEKERRKKKERKNESKLISVFECNRTEFP